MVRLLLNFLPKNIRHWVIRYFLRIPYKVTPRLRFKMAETTEELEQAFKLLHDCYLAQGLTSPHPSGLRCTFYSALPYTSVLIAKLNGRVIGTVSLIKDSSLGLPSDMEFREENDELRKRGYKLVEASALAIHKKFRRTGSVVYLYMMKYLTEFSMRSIGCDTITCSVHPKGMDYYEGLLGFARTSPKIVNYDYVNGALAVHGYIHLNEEYFANLRYGLYKDKGPDRNLFHFTQFQGPFTFPLKTGILNRPVMTLEMLRYFFMEKTDLFSTLEPLEMFNILSVYKLFFDMGPIQEELQFPQIIGGARQDFRFQTMAKALIRCGEDVYFGHLSDLSVNGAFFQTDEFLTVGEIYKIHFKMGNQSFNLEGRVRWKNQANFNQLAAGFGIEFTQSSKEIADFLKERHLINQHKHLQDEVDEIVSSMHTKKAV